MVIVILKGAWETFFLQNFSVIRAYTGTKIQIEQLKGTLQQIEVDSVFIILTCVVWYLSSLIVDCTVRSTSTYWYRDEYLFLLFLIVPFSGIAGIEKKMQQKNATDNKNISKAFQDLDRQVYSSFLHNGTHFDISAFCIRLVMLFLVPFHPAQKLLES